MTKCEQYWAKCCVKIVTKLILATTDVFLIKMWQECYNRRESWVCYFFRRKMRWNFVTSCYYYWKLTKVFLSKIATFFCVCLGVIRMKKNIWIDSVAVRLPNLVQYNRYLVQFLRIDTFIQIMYHHVRNLGFKFQLNLLNRFYTRRH